MNTAIKLYQPLTHVLLKDGRVLRTEKTPEEIGAYIYANPHIVLEGELHSKFDIVSARRIMVDDLESFILSQPEEVRHKVRSKQIWLKETLGQVMTLAYAKNYVTEHC